MVPFAAAPAGAQYINPDTCSMADFSCVQARKERDESNAAAAAQAETNAKHQAEMRALRRELMRLPPLPAERNVLLGSWRLEGGGTGTGLAGTMERAWSYKGGGGAGGGLGELVGALANMNPDKVFCETAFGGGIAFAPSTYRGDGAAGALGGPVEYRSRNKQVIVAIPADTRAQMMIFEIAGPDRIVWGEACSLVRVGAPAAAPGNARTGTPSPPAPPAAGAPPQVAAASPAPPPSTLSRPAPQVCRNTLLDQLGKVGVDQVRAMSGQRFKEAAIEGKVPNSDNLRLDLRGSACDDPRLNATLYDFDAGGMLQSITYVWARPAGPAPAPIFTERVAAIARFHSLPPPQSPGRLQADTSLGRLILQDMPERNLLLEAYKAAK
jgi:hypothetical protein